MISSLISEMINKTDMLQNEIFKPIIYHLNIEKSSNEFVKLFDSTDALIVIDEIKSQLEELIKLRHPKIKFTDEQLQQKISEHIKSAELYKYGVWVYYPWLNKVIHLLGEDEFVEVRTNRNQYKITPEEETLLSTKTIGVIGLSVGKAIAVTIAMERICGELILADFDVIELSNLNRIQTGVQNFNIKKTVVVAREIAEIDPYLKVTCLHEGLTEENMNDFFFPNEKKMDLCIEVCDGLSTKIYARQKAREFGIPVIMSTSDRGMTDIERFDLEKERTIFHGLLNNINLSSIKGLRTNEEKAPIVTAILQDTMSNELKISIQQIGKTISTWPQLASCVIIGGGVTCNISRRILLGHEMNSGRYFIDLEQLIK